MAHETNSGIVVTTDGPKSIGTHDHWWESNPRPLVVIKAKLLKAQLIKIELINALEPTPFGGRLSIWVWRTVGLIEEASVCVKRERYIYIFIDKSVLRSRIKEGAGS